MTLAISMFAGDGGRSGISEYMRQILAEMLSQTDQQMFVLFMCHSDREVFDPKHPRAKVISYSNYWSHPLLSIFWHLVWFPLALRFHRCDAVFMPAANRRLAWYYGIPSVGTVHDMSQLHIPAKYDRFRMFYTMRCLPFLMRRLTRVIAISQSTKEDLLIFAKVPSERITTVYNGANLLERDAGDEFTDAEILEEYDLHDTKYLLYVARIEHPGKNHLKLLEAYSQLKVDKGFEHKLVFVGDRWSGAEIVDQSITKLGLGDDVKTLGYVSSEALKAIYRRADVFVFPSLFEGFGIPLLEAMNAGTAVCCSNRASMPEVVGNAGLLFDPENASDITDSVRSLIRNTPLREKLESLGRERAQSFTWAKSASQVLDAISMVTDGSLDGGEVLPKHLGAE